MSINKFNDQVVCKFFRAKSPHGYIKGGSDAPKDLAITNFASCWCVKTQGPSAPDGGFVDPGLCKQGRKCFKLPEG